MNRLAILAVAAVAAACSTESKPQPAAPPPPSTSPAQQIPIGQLPAVDVGAVLQHTKVLSSDEYEGRAPGTKGEELSVRYLEDQFARSG
jgi:hypothetical protein